MPRSRIWSCIDAHGSREELPVKELLVLDDFTGAAYARYWPRTQLQVDAII
jgi:hypothetical protein